MSPADSVGRKRKGSVDGANEPPAANPVRPVRTQAGAGKEWTQETVWWPHVALKCRQMSDNGWTLELEFTAPIGAPGENVVLVWSRWRRA